ncbi:MAG TPA: phosphatase PAP2 family protein [Sphingobium sp.]|uniref:acid phosphatase n=1 Tax=Sphingobium sp. TaxID=1912891 RepID=UPI002ED493AE
MPEKLSRSTRPTACVMAALIISVSTAVFAAPADEKAQIKRAMPQGYLPAAQLPDSLALLPPPPPAGSAAFARDEEVSRAMARAPDSPRWRQAASDADLHPPVILSHFSCAAGFTADAKTTPTLDRLFVKAVVDIGLSTYRAKDKYQRVRPFVVHGNASCTPGDEKMLSTDGSYPSGHSAIGWGWALILAEIVPEHADAILQRGRDFGQSRLVCNVHWASDVDAGRVIASATVARLHADPAFEADLAAAKAEIARARPPAASVCTSEASALAD